MSFLTIKVLVFQQTVTHECVLKSRRDNLFFFFFTHLVAIHHVLSGLKTSTPPLLSFLLSLPHTNTLRPNGEFKITPPSITHPHISHNSTSQAKCESPSVSFLLGVLTQPPHPPSCNLIQSHTWSFTQGQTTHTNLTNSHKPPNPTYSAVTTHLLILCLSDKHVYIHPVFVQPDLTH